MLIAGIVILLVLGAIILFVNGTAFGSLPSEEDLKRFRRLPYFREGQIQNLHPTPSLTEGVGLFTVLKEFFFDKSRENVPASPLPSKKTDLLTLDPKKNILVWFGHSSYFMQISGKKILVDPVFSGNASPLRFTTKSFDGSDIYQVSDMPDIDYLFLTHDHWDHLDYETVFKLRTKIGRIITGLGVGAHLIFWGFDKKNIEELQWNEQINLGPGFSVYAVTARHFSGRGFQRNRSQWSSFILTTPDKRIFIGGDSGYDSHFAEIGEHLGPFDLAVLEDGQYNKNWKYIHMMPEETVQASIDLKAKKLLPVHWAKFSLSTHAWYEPIIRIKKEAAQKNVSLLHPMIGETVDLDSSQRFSNWWETIH
jgi:L-ascorbate metabolism protein UlaG (beta-lactamase superfamily)